MLNALKCIISKVFVQFMPPLPTKSYTFESDTIACKYTMRLNHGTEWYHVHRYPEKFEAFFTNSSRGNKIACLMVKPCKSPKFTILFSHGGTVDLGNLCNFFYTLANKLNCNIMSYDYSGYGESSGKPTEEEIYADAEAAWDVITQKYSIPQDKIVLYGQSLGTATSIYLAQKHLVKGVILHSPFLSIARIFLPKFHNNGTRFYDSFVNVDNIGEVKSPILIIHGTSDIVVPIAHAYELHKLCKNPVLPLWVEGGGHDDLFTFEEYLIRLKKFIDIDLNNRSMIT